MANMLQKRVERLEQETGTSKGHIYVQWQLSDDAQRLRCAGLEFTREPGESLDDFTDRAARTARDANPEGLLWLEEAGPTACG